MSPKPVLLPRPLPKNLTILLNHNVIEHDVPHRVSLVPKYSPRAEFRVNDEHVLEGNVLKVAAALGGTLGAVEGVRERAV